MTSTINASSTGSGGIVQTADASGVLALQANGTTAFTVNSDATTTFANAANLPNTFGFKNRLINGAGQISQRGLAVAVTNAGVYGADRWIAYNIGGTSLSAITGADASGLGGATNRYIYNSGTWTSGQPGFAQRIEANNCYDLNSNSVTISGKIYHNFGSNQNFTLLLQAATVSDNFTSTTTLSTSTISAVPTGVLTSFTKTVALGSSDATNGLQVQVYLTSAITVTSKFVAITDMQLEKGSVATSFDVRPYTTELALCQRYFCKNSSTTVVATNGTAYGTAGMFSTGAFQAFTANGGYCQWISFPVAMRTEPTTITIINTSLPASPTAGQWSLYNTAITAWVNGSVAIQSQTTSGFGPVISGTWAAGAIMWYGAWTVSAEL